MCLGHTSVVLLGKLGHSANSDELLVLTVSTVHSVQVQHVACVHTVYIRMYSIQVCTYSICTYVQHVTCVRTVYVHTYIGTSCHVCTYTYVCTVRQVCMYSIRTYVQYVKCVQYMYIVQCARMYVSYVIGMYIIWIYTYVCSTYSTYTYVCTVSTVYVRTYVRMCSTHHTVYTTYIHTYAHRCGTNPYSSTLATRPLGLMTGHMHDQTHRQAGSEYTGRQEVNTHADRK